MAETKPKKVVVNSSGIKDFGNKYAIYIVLVVLFVAIGLMENSFFSVGNVLNILIISTIRIIIALGVSGALITRGTDLSAGRVVGFTACIAASLLQRPDYAYKVFKNAPHLSVFVVILIAIAVGLIIGIGNGLVIAYLKVPPFIATLGMMVIVYGFACIYTNARPIGGLRDDFTNLASGTVLKIPNLIIIAAVVIFVMWFIYNKTKFGKYIYAIGGNPDAAEVSGVNVEHTLVKVYALAGAFYGLAGALLAARTGGATNNYAQGYELDAIAACTIGGVSTSGGIGKVSGIITGVLIFEVLNNGLVVLGVSAYWQQVIKGIIIIGAVAFDVKKYLKKK
ncbi:MAG TPA: galactose/methyl galactoside ABC transporter permease MglC [Clostridiaceae bacterium]|jgi:methyl-galactoside transport system permease protein|nr:galactose/methyl galactoside ABC transporter permease MglC [Clostridiaceae bacterium]HBG38849.1 galactose/methyl galactoside ABC transporter permease MglC [Clostridiaceae bacterium]HBN27569.1 galactose/methyl galactoside ABC transporter permease MglC [Clostridiaceae bacterium]HBX48144.1 galactose/methyl galactoside ABC transporter permease MglC [Clostridiaceae bacterium]